MVSSHTLARQVLAAMIAAPEQLAHAVQLQADDFPNWMHQTIFTALTALQYPRHSEPGSIMIQLNAALLEAGHYQDTDNGLRGEVVALAGIQGHPEMLPQFALELVEQRFRQDIADYAARITQHATNSPLTDVYTALAGIDTLRTTQKRLAPTQTLKAA